VKTVAVIPVRMNSYRLPGKVMMPVIGKPLLGHLLDRLECCSMLDDLVVATSGYPENDQIQEFCDDRGTPCFRGSEMDVLDRLLRALRWRNAETGVLIFGDCPLIDPDVVTLVVKYYQSNTGLDFVGNDLSTTYPPGMEVEVFSMDVLAESASRCTDASTREHGTLYIRTHPDVYRLHNLEAPPYWRRPDLSLEVDTMEDMTVIERIIDQFEGRIDYSLDEIIEYMDRNPNIGMINRGIKRRWKPFRGE